MTSVSVVVPHRNHAAYLHRAVDSVGPTAARVPQLGVHHHHSDPDQRWVLDELSADVETVLLDRAQGSAAALNAGLERAAGDVICLLDADDAYAPDKIDRVLSTFDLNPEIGWVFHLRTFVDSQDRRTGQDEAGPDVPLDLVWDTPPLVRSGRLPYLPTSSSCLSARREAWRAIGPLPEHPGAFNDNFAKILLMLQSPGVFLGDRLTLMRLHETNAYSGGVRTWRESAAMHLPTSADLAERAPGARSMARNTAIGVLATADVRWLTGGLRRDYARLLRSLPPADRRAVRTAYTRSLLRGTARRTVRSARAAVAQPRTGG
jgi:cellulose synthase/poly-beta-1,6-N-acetylglucosamine synthase-like glycosyltransferase